MISCIMWFAHEHEKILTIYTKKNTIRMYIQIINVCKITEQSMYHQYNPERLLNPTSTLKHCQNNLDIKWHWHIQTNHEIRYLDCTKISFINIYMCVYIRTPVAVCCGSLFSFAYVLQLQSAFFVCRICNARRCMNIYENISSRATWAASGSLTSCKWHCLVRACAALYLQIIY